MEVNRAPLELVGQDCDAVLGTVVWERPTWQVNQAAVATLREGVRRAAAGEVFRADLTSLASDGRAFTVDATFGPARDCSGRIVEIITSAVDITERKRMEDELLVHSRVLVSMAEGVNFVGDGRSSPVHANLAFDAMFGYAAGESRRSARVRLERRDRRGERCHHRRHPSAHGSGCAVAG